MTRQSVSAKRPQDEAAPQEILKQPRRIHSFRRFKHDEIRLRRVHAAAKSRKLPAEHGAARAGHFQRFRTERLVAKSGQGSLFSQQIDLKRQTHAAHVIGNVRRKDAVTEPESGQAEQLGKGAQHRNTIRQGRSVPHV